ncbi:MAG TPA: ComF family protein, partial [Myxococcota bacterium]|nr:ComF family protein [Myxococcota bacterium]
MKIPPMSIFPRDAAIHLLKKTADLLGGDCFLCANRCPRRLVCVACERSLPSLGPACGRCAAPLPTAGTCGACLVRPPAFDAAAARYRYAFPVDRLLQRFKFAGDLAAGRWLARRLAGELGAHAAPDLVVAAPLAPARLRARGFNQALEVAKVVAAALHAPLDPGALAKVRDTRPQPGLGARERRANLRSAFRCRLVLAGEHV